MSHAPPESAAEADLRQKARAKLARKAQVDATDHHATQAMGVLYELAAAPRTAADALVILHELQVHQVELELQAEEQLSVRSQLEAALARQTQLYDCAPVGYFTLDAQAHLVELNLTGAQQLGVDREALLGQRLDVLLSPADALTLRALLARIAAGETQAVAQLKLANGCPEARLVCASAQVDPKAGQTLLTFTDLQAMT